MDKKKLINEVKEHMKILCSDITERQVGSEGNRKATYYVKQKFIEADWEIDETLLQVMDWETQGATLSCGEKSFEVQSSHYSLGCKTEGKLIAIDSIEKLEKYDITGKIVLLYGEIAAMQIMPKNFIFYIVEDHQRIISLLEEGKPKAVITATHRNSATAGGVYPFPLFEDGDFDIPSVYMKDTEGEKLLTCNGKTVKLESKAKRIPETAFNIIGKKEVGSDSRIVITAHVDAKIGTPGAIDNATGVTTLLLLAEMLKDYRKKYNIELVAFNGEDYYAVPGQMKYLEQNRDKLDNIFLNINIDGTGYKEGLSGFSPFELPETIENALNKVIENNPGIVEGLPWYQGDHSMFIQQGRPAIAVSSQWFIENMECQEITHTPKDNLDIVNYERVAECAVGIKELVESL